MTLLEEWCAALADLGLGTYMADGTAGGTIFTPTLPTEPDQALAVARYAGAEGTVGVITEPRIQIRVRGTADDGRDAERTAQDVYQLVHGLRYRFLAPGGTWLVAAFGVQSGPVYVGRDGNGRHEYTVNVRCII